MLYVGIEWEPQFTLLRYPQHSVHFKWTHGLPREVVRPETSEVMVGVSLACLYDALDKDCWNAFRITLDMDNIEVRTVPGPLCKLPEEIARSNHLLKQFTLWLASHCGPVGVFFPRTIWSYASVENIPTATETLVGTKKQVETVLTKHVNVSCTHKMLTAKYSAQAHAKENHLAVYWRNNLCLTKQRLHLMVPYTWSEYHDLPKIVQGYECSYICKLVFPRRVFHDPTATVTHHTFQLNQDPILIGSSDGATYVDRGGLR